MIARSADDDFTSILACGAGAELPANSDGRDLIDRDRNGTVRRNDGAADLFHGLDAGVRAQEISFAVALDIIRSDCEIGGF